MANKLSQKRIDEMWAAYQERQSIEFVSKKCGGLHWRTVDRYRRLERWDERLTEIRRKAQDEADYDLAKATAASLMLVQAYKEKLAVAMEFKNIADEDVTASEIERIIKVEQLLLGGVESRHEITGNFAGWSEDELRRFAENGERPARTSPRTA
jgi:hypothetical protein